MHSIEVGDVKAVVYVEATVGSPQAFELDSTREDCAGIYVEDQLDNRTEVLEKVREFYAESKTSRRFRALGRSVPIRGPAQRRASDWRRLIRASLPSR